MHYPHFFLQFCCNYSVKDAGSKADKGGVKGGVGKGAGSADGGGRGAAREDEEAASSAPSDKAKVAESKRGREAESDPPSSKVQKTSDRDGGTPNKKLNPGAAPFVPTSSKTENASTASARSKRERDADEPSAAKSAADEQGAGSKRPRREDNSRDRMPTRDSKESSAKDYASKPDRGGGNAGRDGGRDGGRDRGRDGGRDGGRNGSRESGRESGWDSRGATEEKPSSGKERLKGGGGGKKDQEASRRDSERQSERDSSRNEPTGSSQRLAAERDSRQREAERAQREKVLPPSHPTHPSPLLPLPP